MIRIQRVTVIQVKLIVLIINLASEDEDTFINELTYNVHQRTIDNSVRVCLKCNKFKPDRSHHCKFCDQCILKIDHHCPWVNTCIGFNNYKFFVLMILYGYISSLIFCFIYFDVIKLFLIEEKIISKSLIFFVLVYTVLAILSVCLTLFLIFHFWLALRNLTTYEFVTEILRHQKGLNSENMFYLSKYENFKQVFGNNILTWFLPFNTICYSNFNNGLNFQINRKENYEVIKSV